jgi:hypothetical protein
MQDLVGGVALVLVLGLAGCSYYSFSGATIPEEYETIAIRPITNETASTEDLEDELNQLLNERFVERTRLRLETNENEADVVLTGRITGYDNDEPVAVSGDDGATRNEVTIRAEIRYYDPQSDEEDLIDETYTQSETYDLSAPTENVGTAASLVLENIADAVFSDATADW